MPFSKLDKDSIMSPKKKRQISKGTRKRYASNKPKPQAAPIRRIPPPPSYAEKALRKRISQFGLSTRFKDEFEQAFEQYMGSEAIQKQGDRKILILDEADSNFPGFQEWFYFDYVLQSGKHIIDLFAEELGPQLAANQRKIFEDWLATNCLRLLETQSVEPGVGETMQDLLSGEIFALNDISYSYHGIRWSIFLARPLLTEGRWHFTGSGIMLSPLEKSAMLEFAGELWSAYQERHPQADLGDFYRDSSLDLYKKAREIQRKRSHDVYLSNEGHPLIKAKAEFAISTSDPGQVESALDETEEFVFVGESREGEFSGCLHYVWLLRGRSFVPDAPKDRIPTGALMLSGSWIAGPGEPDYRTLGDLNLCWERLILSCLSRERLDAGKKLLGQILGKKINHRRDHFEEFEIPEEELDWDEGEWLGEADWEKEKDLDPELLSVDAEMRDRLTLRWLDTPNDQGITPRQAAKTDEGRASLHEQFKLLEYLEAQALKSGQKPPMNLDLVRKELGL
jgi:hypothetical protein